MAAAGAGAGLVAQVPAVHPVLMVAVVVVVPAMAGGLMVVFHPVEQ